MRRRIWTSWWFRIWSSSCSWWRCSLWRICNLFLWIYIFFCILNHRSCWFVCFVKPGDVCLGFHRSENWFGHAGVRLLSRRIIRHRDERSCLGVWNISFYFYCLNFFFFYEELTVFRGGHMRFPTIGTLVSIFTSVAIMNTWNRLFSLCIDRVHVQISDIWSNVHGLEYMGLPWRYKVQCEWKLVC